VALDEMMIAHGTDVNGHKVLEDLPKLVAEKGS